MQAAMLVMQVASETVAGEGWWVADAVEEVVEVREMVEVVEVKGEAWVVALAAPVVKELCWLSLQLRDTAGSACVSLRLCAPQHLCKQEETGADRKR